LPTGQKAKPQFTIKVSSFFNFSSQNTTND